MLVYSRFIRRIFPLIVLFVCNLTVCNTAKISKELTEKIGIQEIKSRHTIVFVMKRSNCGSCTVSAYNTARSIAKISRDELVIVIYYVKYLTDSSKIWGNNRVMNAISVFDDGKIPETTILKDPMSYVVMYNKENSLIMKEYIYKDVTYERIMERIACKTKIKTLKLDSVRLYIKGLSERARVFSNGYTECGFIYDSEKHKIFEIDWLGVTVKEIYDFSDNIFKTITNDSTLLASIRRVELDDPIKVLGIYQDISAGDKISVYGTIPYLNRTRRIRQYVGVVERRPFLASIHKNSKSVDVVFASDTGSCSDDILMSDNFYQKGDSMYFCARYRTYPEAVYDQMFTIKVRNMKTKKTTALFHADSAQTLGRLEGNYLSACMLIESDRKLAIQSIAKKVFDLSDSSYYELWGGHFDDPYKNLRQLDSISKWNYSDKMSYFQNNWRPYITILDIIRVNRKMIGIRYKVRESAEARSSYYMMILDDKSLKFVAELEDSPEIAFYMYAQDVFVKIAVNSDGLVVNKIKYTEN